MEVDAQMKTATMRKLAALVTGVALAFSFPVASSADKGGVPNANSEKPKKAKKPCPKKGKGNGPKKPAPNAHGKKCGYQKTA